MRAQATDAKHLICARTRWKGEEMARLTPGRQLVPETPIASMHSYASQLFGGATRREVRWAWRHSTTWWKRAAASAALVVVLPVTWAADVVWFVVVALVFGLLMFPYRLMRWGVRPFRP
jgi:hypothetical protein